ncbi:hypothetical protein IFM47457_11108 [Aspergillus lentulus]|nr:hypothetical protein IFM47457_11108 [Aspergillus lentulus]
MVSTLALKVESNMLLTHLYLKQQGQIVAASLSTLPESHPALWRTPAFTEINIKPDREKAKENASARQKAAGVTVFSNASGQQNHLGAAAVALNQDGNITQSWQISVGLMEYWSVHTAELMAIYYTISLVYQISQKKQEALGTSHEPATILIDSHCDDLGNDIADCLAKEAVGCDKLHPFQYLLSREKGYIRCKIREEWGQE